MTKQGHLVVAACVLSACGGANSAIGSTLPREVTAPGAGAARYETGTLTSDSAPPETQGAQWLRAVHRGVTDAAQSVSMEVLRDARLGTLAEWISEHLMSDGTPPPSEVVELFTRHLGLVEPIPRVVVIGLPDALQLEQKVYALTREFLARQPYTRFGAHILQRGDRTLAVLVVSTRLIEMQPLSRSAAAGTDITVRGRLLAGTTEATPVVQSPGGEVQRLPSAANDRVEFHVQASTPGTYRIEIMAKGRYGDMVVANFPIYVGVAAPSSVRLTERTSDRNTDDVRSALIAKIQAERRALGLGPLIVHADLDVVAAAHSEDMRAHRFVGHVSSSTGSAADRLNRAGYRSTLVLENIGRGYSAEEIHRGLLESPAHRANLIHPDATHVGVGVVAEAEDGRTAYLATQVFVRLAERIDVSEAAEGLLEQLNRVRSTRRARAVEHDPNLQAAAQQAAEAFFEDGSLSQQDVVDLATSSLRRLGIAFRRIGSLMAVVSAIEETSRLEPALDPEVGAVGIGVAQGARPDTQSNAIAVVIVLGWPR